MFKEIQPKSTDFALNQKFLRNAKFGPGFVNSKINCFSDEYEGI